MQFAGLVVVGIIMLVFLGVQGLKLQFFFGVIIPYLALVVFCLGLIGRVVKWGRSPVPFSIPTVHGQQKSLPWIKASAIDSPVTTAGVVARLALEVLFFRSLFKNVKAELGEGRRLTFTWEKWLWLAGLLFHWSFLVVIFRHLRFFTEPVPAVVHSLGSLDGFFQVGLQAFFITDLIILATVLYLLLRRVCIPQMRYISLPADYFPLFVIFGIALSGISMRYFFKVDIAAVKKLAMGLVTFKPVLPEGIGVIFYIHLFLVCVLFAYFPFSKLMHMAGIFMAPTRNLANDSRARRHVNPWNYPVKVHTYADYEAEFGRKMEEAGLPVENSQAKVS